MDHTTEEDLKLNDSRDKGPDDNQALRDDILFTVMLMDIPQAFALEVFGLT